jgi:hypothetical protein
MSANHAGLPDTLPSGGGIVDDGAALGSLRDRASRVSARTPAA